MQQYLSIKEKYADAILFYRMGDFYEMFYGDAEEASRILEITLTSRNKREESQVPMCGVPVRAAQGYIARLIESGRKVAVCEQTEDPAAAKGLVAREVVRVITPGMILEDAFLDEKANNFILALVRREGRYGISWLDISTGGFKVAESKHPEVIVEEALRVSPSEILLPQTADDKEDPALRRLSAGIPDTAVSRLEDRRFDPGDCYERLTRRFGTLSLEGFGCEGLRAGISAAGGLLHYVQETQKQDVAHITRIETCVPTRFLLVDDGSARNLELLENLRTRTRTGTLLGVLDRTMTAMGGRLLKEWVRYPLLKRKEIGERLDAVGEAKGRPDRRHRLREHLRSVHDLERLGSKVVMGHANARDLLGLKRSLSMLPGILEELSRFEASLLRWREDRQVLAELAGLIESALREDAPPTVNEGGMIREGYNSELDELIAIGSDGKGALVRMEAQEKSATGINSLKVGYNKVFGYFIEVPKARAAAVPPHYIRKQTLVNAERYITDELKTYETKVLGAQERRATLEYEIFNEVRGAVMEKNRQIQGAARFLARLDCLLALAHAADENDYVRPEIDERGALSIEGGRHPVVEKMITGERFVPNTIRMDNHRRQVLVITGPNMAGKSTVLRQVALVVIMAQMGAFVPATRARIPLTDRIFTRVGALDNLSQGQSTFMVEMQETANILNNATPKSLVILDEIGRGTSTFDGLSIAWAVADYLHDYKGKGVKTLFATHYHELTALEGEKERVKNYNIAVKEWRNEIIFLRKLVEGGTNRSYGIQVARLAGIPDPVIRTANRILRQVESRNSDPVKDEGDRSHPPGIGEGHVQLGLFGDPHPLVEEIRQLDIASLTPAEAKTRLNEFQKRARTLH